jgi:hypothetical protein
MVEVHSMLSTGRRWTTLAGALGVVAGAGAMVAPGSLASASGPASGRYAWESVSTPPDGEHAAASAADAVCRGVVLGGERLEARRHAPGRPWTGLERCPAPSGPSTAPPPAEPPTQRPPDPPVPDIAQQIVTTTTTTTTTVAAPITVAGTITYATSSTVNNISSVTNTSQGVAAPAAPLLDVCPNLRGAQPAVPSSHVLAVSTRGGLVCVNPLTAKRLASQRATAALRSTLRGALVASRRGQLLCFHGSAPAAGSAITLRGSASTATLMALARRHRLVCVRSVGAPSSRSAGRRVLTIRSGRRP